MSGWTNYAFNVYPLLKPCLNNFYDKMQGKSRPEQRVYTNTAVRADFRWAKRHIELSNGVHVLKSRLWGKSDADNVFYCDASLEGMGFWDTGNNLGFYAPTSPLDEAPKDVIFLFEALCVLSALSHVHGGSDNCARRIVIHTDSSNTFDIFNSLRCRPMYNHILKSAVDILVDGSHDLRVLHIAGVDNGVADALSCFDFARAEELSPGLIIRPFQPPRFTMGRSKK